MKNAIEFISEHRYELGWIMFLTPIALTFSYMVIRLIVSIVHKIMKGYYWQDDAMILAFVLGTFVSSIGICLMFTSKVW